MTDGKTPEELARQYAEEMKIRKAAQERAEILRQIQGQGSRASSQWDTNYVRGLEDLGRHQEAQRYREARGMAPPPPAPAPERRRRGARDQERGRDQGRERG